MVDDVPVAPADVLADAPARPWHGSASPLEALFDHFTAEIAALKARLDALTAPPDVPVETAPEAADPAAGAPAVEASAASADAGTDVAEV